MTTRPEEPPGADPAPGAPDAVRSASDAGETGDEVRVDLPDDLRAPAEARRAVRVALGQWRLPALVDAVSLAVSELVTNAVRHGLPPVRLVLQRRSRDVRVDVHDEGQGEPTRRTAGEAEESGRGLAIVEAVSETSGVEQVDDDGKITYATFEAPPLRDQP